jgi:hypothetical protein
VVLSLNGRTALGLAGGERLAAAGLRSGDTLHLLPAEPSSEPARSQPEQLDEASTEQPSSSFIDWKPVRAVRPRVSLGCGTSRKHMAQPGQGEKDKAETQRG